MADLTGMVVLVTGAGRGIGRAACERLARDGASVAVLDIDLAAAEQTSTGLEAIGVKSVAVHCDVTDEASVERAVAQTVQQLGPITGLFANAGLGGVGMLHELSLEAWNRVVEVNLTGVFLTVKHVLPSMMAAGGGSIVTTGSLSSVIATPGAGAASYKASKGGVNIFTKSIAVDYAAHNIRANCLCPGSVDTEFAQHAIGTRPQLGSSTQRVVAPMGRQAAASELASVLSFLLSEDASYVTGTTMMVDGGYTAI